MFFGKQPEEYFEKAIIRCVAFEGLDKRFIVDDKFYAGPLYFQYTKAIHWLKEKLNIRYDIEGQGSGPRREIWEIPETVFKEAIINSLSHRNYYDKGATITIELFDDRIEISNPGGLVSAISRADFGKRSYSRNPLIFNLFTRMNMVEQIGSGITRMKDLMKGVGLPEPSYTTEDMFTVTFKRPIKTSEKTSEKILRLIKDTPSITIKDLAERLNKSTRTIEINLQRLRIDKRIDRIGPDKGGHWQISD